MRGARAAVIPSDLLLAAYSSGWFPMADEAGTISWYSPDPRGVLPLETFHVPSRLQRTMRRSALQVRVDTMFADVMRACAEAERQGEDGGTWISDEIIASYTALHTRGYAHSVEVRDGKGRIGSASVELRYRRVHVLPPIGKQKRYPALTLTVIHARERTAPPDRPAIDWKLITDLPVLTCEAAIEKLHWYALRWKIEVFHKVLKSGCRAEEARLRTAERLVKLIALFCILSWRVFWMTMINRSAPHAVPGLALTETELVLLDRLVPDKPQARTSARTLSSYLIKVARLGGYLARSRDPPPGNIVMWRGLSRLTDITLGAKLARTAPICG